MRYRRLEMHGVAVLFAALCAVHCGSEDDDPNGAGGSSGSGPSAGTGSEPTAGSDSEPTAGSGSEPTAGSGSGDEIPTLNGCAESAYVDQSAEDGARIVQIASAGLVFTPRCLLIAAGQSVTFEGSLAAHPIAPGNANDDTAGSPDNPIQPTSSGRSVSFAFPEPGTYPYFCELHGFGDGSGMSGTIHVR